MHRWEKTMREERYSKHDAKNPSFSSSLLDEICRSIDDGEPKHEQLRFHGEIMPRKLKGGASGIKIEGEEGMPDLQRACLIEKFMEQKVSQKVMITQQRRQNLTEFERKSQLDHDLDQDAIFSSSTSTSSDSSSGGLSSSDTESMYGGIPRASSFNPPGPKPVRSSASVRSGKTERTLFYEQREVHMFDDYHYNSASEQTPTFEENLIKSKSRAFKIYSNLKKMKQPISPGSKLASFLNSLFTTGNTKKSKNSPSIGNFDEESKLQSGQASTCSSASSFSRSCLSKNSPSTREKLRNGVKRSVRFYPVSVIVDEDCRPVGHKSLKHEEEESSLMSVSLPKEWKIGKSPSRKTDDELNYHAVEKSRRIEEVAREFLKDYHQNQNKKDVFKIDVGGKYTDHFEDEDDDAASCSSSDLFELDHLALIGKDCRYSEELPVYETTHPVTNRAIANGLIV